MDENATGSNDGTTWADAYTSLQTALDDSSAYTDVQGGWTGEGNFNLDPLFLDGANGVLKLHHCSPCIDTGDNTLIQADDTDLNQDNDRDEQTPRDIALGARVIAVESETALVDRGAYEKCLIGDMNENGAVYINDLTSFLSCFGTQDCTSNGCCRADLACPPDGVIALGDLTILLAHFGDTCPPPLLLTTASVATSVEPWDTNAYGGGGFEGESRHFVLDVIITINTSADDWTGCGVTVTAANGAVFRLVPNAGNPPTPGSSDQIAWRRLHHGCGHYV